MWNENRECIYHCVGIILEDIRDNLMLSTSEWLERFKGEAVDYLLKRHFPKTLRTLERLKDSEFLKAILEVDGLPRLTRLQLQRCLVLGEDEDNLSKVPIGRNDNKAGPSGTANATV
jgi:hypothetical protein